MPKTTSDTWCSLSTECVEHQPGREGSWRPEVGEPDHYGRGLCFGSGFTTQPETVCAVKSDQQTTSATKLVSTKRGKAAHDAP